MASDAVYDAVLGSLTLAQVTAGTLSTNATPVAGTNSGELDVNTYYGGRAEPRVTFSSTNVSSVVGVANICTAGISVSTGTITIPFQKRANQSTFAAGLSHFTVSGTNGLIFPTTFSCNQDDDGAVANLECYFRSTDGVTNPIATNSSQALASQTFIGLYGLGPCNLLGTALSEVVGISVGTGIEVRTESHNGGLYPDRIYIVRRRPFFDLTFNDFDDIDTIIPDAVWTSIGSNCDAYFRQRAGTGYTANGSAAHIKFTLSSGVIDLNSLRASGADSGQATVRVWGTSLTAAAGSTIT